jgi:hypothetical protein
VQLDSAAMPLNLRCFAIYGRFYIVARTVDRLGKVDGHGSIRSGDSFCKSRQFAVAGLLSLLLLLVLLYNQCGVILLQLFLVFDMEQATMDTVLCKLNFSGS